MQNEIIFLQYLDVKGGIAGEGKEVILSKMTTQNQDSQTWTANWGMQT